MQMTQAIKNTINITLLTLSVLMIGVALWRIYSLMQIKNQLVSLSNKSVTIQQRSRLPSTPVQLYGVAMATGILPLSNLPLTLQGISYTGAQSNQNTAIIQSENDPAKIFQAGDALPFGAKIIKILPNQVNINHNGQQERLIIQKPTLKETPNAS